MDTTRWPLGVAAAVAALVAGSCNRDSGQTGSPFQDPPSYETPGRFSPRQPDRGGHTGDGDDPNNRPTHRRTPGELAVLLDSGHLVTAAQDRALRVYDVGGSAAPRRVGELAIRGRALQLEANGTTIVYAVSERNSIDAPVVPEEPLFLETQRLIAVDLTNPAQPVRRASVDLDSDFWQFEARGTSYFVLGEVHLPAEPFCGEGRTFFEGFGTEALRVVRYDLGESGFDAVDSVELPADESFAFYSGDAFFTVDGYFASAETPGSLTWGDFSSGALSSAGPVPLTGPLQAVARDGNALLTLSGNTLETWLLDAAGGASRQGSLALGGSGQPGGAGHPGSPSVTFLSSGQYAALTGSGATLVDVRDLGSPSIASVLPAEVLAVQETTAGLLGFGNAGGAGAGGPFALSLWDVTLPSTPTSLGRLETSWFFPYVDSLAHAPWTIDEDRGWLVGSFSAMTPEANTNPRVLGVMTFGAAGVTLHSAQTMQSDATGPPLVGPASTDGSSWAFGVSWEGLEKLPLLPGAEPGEPRSTFVPFFEREPTAELSLEGYDATLWEHESDGVFTVELTPEAGGETTLLELTHRGDGFVAVGDRLVVMGLYGDAALCEEFADMGADPIEIAPPDAPIDPCASFRARGVTVIALDGEPRVVRSVPISTSMDFEAPAPDITTTANWLGHFSLPDGRLAFLVQRIVRCSSYESCEALGAPAYESFGSPGCNPDVQDCSELPAVETFVNGADRRLHIYVLNGSASEDPALDLEATLDGTLEHFGEEDSLDVSWMLLPDDGGFGFAREEPIYNSEGNSVVNEHDDPIVRFFLERIRIGSDGSLEPLPSINTPGRVVALDGESAYSVEPTYASSGQVSVLFHRSRLENGGAFIEETLELGEGFLDARFAADHIFVLRGPADPCAEHATTDLFAVPLDPGALAEGDALVLPGRGWGFPRAPVLRSGDLLIEGGPLAWGRLYVDVQDPLSPSVVRYVSTGERSPF